MISTTLLQNSVRGWCGLGAATYLTLRLVTRAFAPEPPAQVTRNIRLANRCVAMSHAIGSLGLAARALYYQPLGLWWENAPVHSELAYFSLGYFVWDTIYMLVYERDALFLLHHTAGILFWCVSLASNRYGSYGALGILIGELTNPLQLTWAWARDMKMTRVYRALSAPFTYLFVAARCVAMPLALVSLMRCIWAPSDHHSASSHISVREKSLVTVVSAAFVCGGLAWSRTLWRGYRRFSARA